MGNDGHKLHHRMQRRDAAVRCSGAMQRRDALRIELHLLADTDERPHRVREIEHHHIPSVKIDWLSLGREHEHTEQCVDVASLLKIWPSF